MYRLPFPSFVLAVALGIGSSACVTDELTSHSSLLTDDTSRVVLWAEDDASGRLTADTNEVIVSLQNLAAESPEDVSAAMHELAGHLVVLDGIVGLYLEQLQTVEAKGGSLDDLRASYDRTPLAKHASFDVLIGGQPVHAAAVESWVSAAYYRELETNRAIDYDDDGDLDLFLVNAPGGDNASPCWSCRNNLKQIGIAIHDIDGDGDLDLGLTAAPGVVAGGPFLVYAIQKAS